MEKNLVDIGKEIKKYRIESGMSQEQLSSLCGVVRAQLSRVEAGEVLGVTYATIEKILNSLGRTLSPSKIETKPLVNLHPFVKWAGGKTQLLNTIESRLPKKFNRYFEPFVGGGALLLKIQPNNFYINDINGELICAYQCFQNDDLFNALKNELEKHEKNHSEETFDILDNVYNINDLECNIIQDLIEANVFIRKIIQK